VFFLVGSQKIGIQSVSPRCFGVALLTTLLWLCCGVAGFGAAHAEDFSVRLDSTGYHFLAGKALILENIPNGLTPKDVSLELYDPNFQGRLPFLKGKSVYKFKNIVQQVNTLQQGPGSERWVADFSDFQQPGAYQLLVNGAQPNTDGAIPLTVSEFIYWEALKPVARSFYLHRSGQVIADNQTGLSLGLGHPDDALVIDTLSGETYRKDVAGGWYNGNDFNKYITTTALSAAQLLSAYELNPKTMRLFEMNYPSSEQVGSMPDLLKEISVGLDWVLAMQRNDGAFYRKVAGKSLVTSGLPEDDEQPRYVFGVTSQDTAMATGALAMASRVYKKSDYSYAVKAIMAAERGWHYLAKNAGWQADVNVDDDAGSLEYLNPKGDLNYRFWAATELYTATGKPIYHDFIKAHYHHIAIEPLSWQNPAFLGIVNYLRYADNPDLELTTYFKTNLLKGASLLMARTQTDAFHHTLSHFDYGSNLQLLQHLFFLTTAWQLTGDSAYAQQAAESLRFLYGVNPLGQTFVTDNNTANKANHGQKSATRPHNTLVMGSKKLIPGLLVSGPNADASDGITVPNLGPLSYADSPAAVDSNQSEIVYNAALVNILSQLNDIFNQIQQQADTTEAPISP